MPWGLRRAKLFQVAFLFMPLALHSPSVLALLSLFMSLLGSGYSLLDNLMGKGWDVKSLRGDVADCHFKFVTLLTVYLDKKTLLLSFHFHIQRLLFLLARITAKSARHYPSDVNMQVHI